MENGNLLVQESMSHDLVIYNMNMVELFRAAGEELDATCMEKEDIITTTRRTYFTDEGTSVLWFNGLSRLSVFCCLKFTHHEIGGFWDYGEQKALGVLVCCTTKQKKIFGIGHCSGAYTIHSAIKQHKQYLLESATVSQYYTSNIYFIAVEDHTCLEMSLEQSFLIIGGTETVTGVLAPKLVVISVGNQISFNCEKVFTDLGFKGGSSICSLVRYPHGNIFFAGCFRMLLVIFFDGQSLQLITKINCEEAEDIVDLRFAHESLYFISPNLETINIIDFSLNLSAYNSIKRDEENDTVRDSLNNHTIECFPIKQCKEESNADKLDWLGCGTDGRALFMKDEKSHQLLVIQKDEDNRFNFESSIVPLGTLI